MIPIAEVVQPADVQQLADSEKRDAITFVEQNQIAVVDLVTLEHAVQLRARIGEKQKAISEKLAKPKAWAYGLHRWFCELEKTALHPLDTLDKYEAQQIRVFKQQQDRERQQRERELADEQRREREARAATEAAQLESAGEVEMAAAVMQEAISAPAPVVSLRDETRGIAKFIRRWKWKFAGGPEDVATTPPELIARTMKLIPRDFLCVDDVKLGAYARSMKGSSSVAGIDFYHVDDPVR